MLKKARLQSCKMILFNRENLEHFYRYPGSVLCRALKIVTSTLNWSLTQSSEELTPTNPVEIRFLEENELTPGLMINLGSFVGEEKPIQR